MFLQIFRFEMAYHVRQPLIYVISVILFLLSFGDTVSDNISIGGVLSNININSPYNLVITLSSLSFITALLAGVVYASSPIVRDFDHKVAELFFTTRVSKFDYLFGRFCGAFVFCVLVYFASLLGVLLGEFMPWLDPERLGPVRLDAYWFATWAIAIPNLLFIAALVFLIATLTRSLIASYVVLVLMLVLSAVIGTLADPDDIRLLSLLDPFGDFAIQDITRYWTPFQRNEMLVPLEGNFLYNRLLIAGLLLACIGAAYHLFPFSIDFAQRKAPWWRRQQKTPAATAAVAIPVPSGVVSAAKPTIHRHFAFRAQCEQFYSLLKIEIHNILIGKAFLMLAIIGMVQVVVGAYFGLEGLYGTNIYPTTSALLNVINGSYSLPLIAVIVFYSSELLVREKQLRVAEMLDSMPFPNWVVIAAKLGGIILVIAFMLLAAMAAGILVQIAKGYYSIELGHYVLGLFSFFQFPIWFTCVIAVFAQVVTGNRYLGMFLVVVYLVILLFVTQMGFEHNLYLFNTPQIAWSIFTGFGPNLTAFLWYSLYWSLFCVLLLIVMHLLWQRGSDSGSRFRWRSIRARLSRPIVMLASACAFGIVLSGGYIYYNTNVLNPYITRIDIEERTADYEKAYKQYADLPYPDAERVYAEVDIFPELSEAHIEGHYVMRNNNAFALTQLHMTVPAYITINALGIPNATQTLADKDLGYYIYELNPPLQPGESFQLDFDLDWLTPGFVNNNPTTSVLSNGTFFNNTEVMPLPGYQQDRELVDNNRRRRYDLPPAQRMARIDDPIRRDIGLGTRRRVEFETIVSTSDAQIAVAPGYLQREWQEAGRRYFHYKMDAPIWPFVAFLSADYAVKADQWNDVKLEVYYKHEVNVERMLEASKKSLDYFTRNFSPYQYQQYRIFEFPIQRGTFAQSFPNTIPFSEGIGFVADIRDPENIDYVFYVTAHELAHQWWGHQVAGADVQGAAVITETLSQYSALMVMEKEYGPHQMRRFLKYELDRYLSNRGSEVIEEMPLMLVENQGYIHYRKGSLVMYALRDYLGEETVNQILRDMIAAYGFQGPPYPTTRDFISIIRSHAAPEYQDLITDLFEKIVLFDLRADDSSYRQLPDGSFEVTINVAATKFEADGQGQETAVPLDLPIDIAVLGEEDEATKQPAVLYMEKQRITQQTQSFTVQVPTRPVSVGIDPFNKLIDRNPDDNTRRLGDEGALSEVTGSADAASALQTGP